MITVRLRRKFIVSSLEPNRWHPTSVSNLSLERTLNLLYSAQQQHQNSCEAQPQTDMAMAAPPQPDTQGRREAHQRSLDSFWRLPVTAPSSAPSSPAAQQNVTPNCEDCGAGLGDGADMMMDVDGLDPKGRSCSACVKTVCFSCSISNLGDRRRCLACAERNVLVGSVGWTQVGAC